MRVADEHGEFVNCVWYQVQDYEELKMNFRSASHLPMFRSFRNFATANEKRDSSLQVYFNSEDNDDTIY